MALALRASLSAPTRAVHAVHAATRVGPAVGPRRALTVVRHAQAGHGYESGE